MRTHVPYLRIFLSSPGDVAEERKIAIDVIESLPYRPAFRDKVAFRIIAWDKLGADTPMLGSLTPQEAIKRGLPRPSDCDITIVIFWKRLGTPFIDTTDGEDYESGTHWELADALKNEQCETLIYRRTEEVKFSLDSTEEKHQYERLQTFFESDVFYHEDGRILRGVNAYAKPEDFRSRLQSHLEQIVLRILETVQPRTHDTLLDQDGVEVITAEVRDWPEGKSPFPGLRSFTSQDSEIFFGRSYETGKLVRHVAANRFVAVVGASGSGKSSLVGAGLLPHLVANAISSATIGSKDWIIVRFTPGKSANPFEAIAEALIDEVPALACTDPIDYPEQLEKLTVSLQKSPDRLSKTLNHALKREKAWAEIFIVADQFEELFTLVDEEYIRPFAQMLAYAAQDKAERVRVVATIRADFYHRAVQIPELSDLLRDGSFPLAAPNIQALREMIERPSERAGVEWDDGLVDRILQDTGEGAGNLALMAYALDELYKNAEANRRKRITFADYEMLKGVRGAIGVRAENTFHELNVDETLLQRVFQLLVEVDEHGIATRRRARYVPAEVSEPARRLVDAFVDARLLVTDYDPETEQMTVEVAHEAILREWKRLSDWVDASQEDMFRLRQLRDAVNEWTYHNRRDSFLWSVEQVHVVVTALERLRVQPDEDTQEFLITALTPATKPDFIDPPDHGELLPLLTDVTESPLHRHWAGIWLAHIGDARPGVGVIDGVPDLIWCDVPGGKSHMPITHDTINVPDFRMAMYQITNAQFAAFVNADDGLRNDRWWDGLLSDMVASPLNPREPWFPYATHPRECVSWVQAVAFCRWLDAKLRAQGLIGDGEMLRLPTEWEWERAAIGDQAGQTYPYAQDFAPHRANTSASHINMTSAVGMYPDGVSYCGVHDLSGNVWEWCFNRFFDLLDYSLDFRQQRALRGGAWASPPDQATAQIRWRWSPDDWSYWAGFRVCIAHPIDLNEQD